METIPLKLDGYTDLPPGKIANVVTYLEVLALPAITAGERPDLSVRHATDPDIGWYRGLVRLVGEDWLWFSRAVMSDTELAAFIADPAVAILVLERSGKGVGIAELDRRIPGEVEISLFGVVAAEIGTGAARFLMAQALPQAFAGGASRVWLHTCSFDHPAAVRFYVRFGFRAYKYAIEVSDDPRLTGLLPATAAPHIPLIWPAGAPPG